MSGASNKITDDELNALILRLGTLLPQLNHGRHGRVASSSTTKILKETCSYIRRLQKEVDDLSERLSQCLDSMDITSSDAEFLTNLLQQ
ncbi:hypothetical protein Goshw_029883 [Gossypium schwendimanii]|uniref:BHLH domain-containing protein n=3 Tax=Gossypium TaxID=3633 RepID=A0A7J9C6F9_GOSGO|nr:hypothetical protein [Gossypium laxum]MBA0744073.1 hypothetical protein [Gossypium gossypioides]MBA0864093.1 hypothetical protein [Gossypium schwendimanii]